VPHEGAHLEHRLREGLVRTREVPREEALAGLASAAPPSPAVEREREEQDVEPGLVEGADAQRQPVDARIAARVSVQADDDRRLAARVAPPARMGHPVLPAADNV